MATETPKGPARRLRASGGFCGHAHGILFDDKGLSAEPVGEADAAKLREAFPTVTFTPVEEQKPAVTAGAKSGAGEQK